MWSTVKSFGMIKKAEVDIFLELTCFFCDPMDVDSLNSDSSAFSKSSLNIWKFTVHVLLKPALENFEHYFASVWDEYSCAVVSTFFGIAFFGGLEWKLTFSSPVATTEFSTFAGILSEPILARPWLITKLYRYSAEFMEPRWKSIGGRPKGQGRNITCYIQQER